jgi:hypothetical protein
MLMDVVGRFGHKPGGIGREKYAMFFLNLISAMLEKEQCTWDHQLPSIL